MRLSAKPPEPSAAMEIIEVGMESLVEVLGRKQGERLLLGMAQKLSARERLSTVVKLRPSDDDEAKARARREAMVWLQEHLPQLMARTG
jgi:hypothetical protein